MSQEDTVAELRATLAATGVDVGSASLNATLRPSARFTPSTPPSAAIDDRLPTLRVVGEAEASGAERPDFELKARLGEGGMGVVWLARQPALDRDVAIKTLHEGSERASLVASLLDEARATGALEHPSIVPVHAVGVTAAGQPVLVMKRVEGASLQELLDDDAHPAWEELVARHGDRHAAIVDVLLRVSDALHFAHSRGFVHRDVKPENVMVGRFGETYLLDWGVAMSLDEPDDGRVRIVGTPTFLAPELALGRRSGIDARADVYLLGATLHAALTGRPPHEGDTIQALLFSALTSEPRQYDDSVPAELAGLMNAAMSREREERPASALEFRTALAEYVRHRGSSELAREAQRSLDAGRGEADPTSAAATRALAEARFGFTNALRAWPDNPEALVGREAALRLSIEAELLRGAPESARALLDELGGDAALEARIEEVKRAEHERTALAERAREAAYQSDATLVGGHLTRLGVVLGTYCVFAALLIGSRHRVPLDGRSLVLWLTVGFLAVLGGAILAYRREFLVNRRSRQILFVVGGAGLLDLTLTVVGFVAGYPAEHDMPYRLLILSAIWGTRAVDANPMLWVAFGIGVAGSVLAALWPSIGAYALALMLAAATGALLWAARTKTADATIGGAGSSEGGDDAPPGPPG